MTSHELLKLADDEESYDFQFRTSDTVIDAIREAAEIVAKYEFIRDHLAVSEHGSGELPMWSFKHLPGRHATFDAAVESGMKEERDDG